MTMTCMTPIVNATFSISRCFGGNTTTSAGLADTVSTIASMPGPRSTVFRIS